MVACLLLFFVLAFGACVDDEDSHVIQSHGDRLTVALTRGKTNTLRLFADDSLSSEWPLRYPVYRFAVGDINEDGSDDIVVGVVKKTRRDSVSRKRLFIFQVRPCLLKKMVCVQRSLQASPCHSNHGCIWRTSPVCARRRLRI